MCYARTQHGKVSIKTCGFCLESIHFNDPERLNKLIALLAISSCWALLTWMWQAVLHVIKIKKHGRSAKSLFRSCQSDFQRLIEQAIQSGQVDKLSQHPMTQAILQELSV
jgi:hypothetical protein